MHQRRVKEQPTPRLLRCQQKNASHRICKNDLPDPRSGDQTPTAASDAASMPLILCGTRAHGFFFFVRLHHMCVQPLTGLLLALVAPGVEPMQHHAMQSPSFVLLRLHAYADVQSWSVIVRVRAPSIAWKEFAKTLLALDCDEKSTK